MTVRIATPEDAGSLAHLHVATWRSAYVGIVPDSALANLSVDARTQRWAQSITEKPGSVLVGESDGVLEALASFGPCRDSDLSSLGELYALYVRPERWRSGGGRQLLLQVERSLFAQRFPAITLWVLEGNARGRSFYEALGYRVEGAHKDIAFGETRVNELRYRKELV